MNRDEITRIIQDNGLFHGTMALGVVMDADHLEKFANLVAAAEREKVAEWMMKCGYATGHGESIEDLLGELAWQIAEKEREACAKILDEMAAKDKLTNYYVVAALAIRERGAP